MWRRVLVSTVMVSALGAGVAEAATRGVGPGQAYATPCQAIRAAQAGDVIQIDATGTYANDTCTWSTANLTIEGVNGRPRITSSGQIGNGKGIWVTSGPNTVVRNVELSGAAVADRNGAAIRVEGDGDLTLVGSYLHDNENGILTGASAASEIVVDSTELANNGFGDGQSHNIYVGNAGAFTLRSSYSHDAKIGHLVKSRARVNEIVGNRLIGGAGTGSYELDLPNAGQTRVVGNVFQQGPNTQNSTLLAYGLEGASNPSRALIVEYNTFVNDRSGNATAIRTAVADPPAIVTRNIAAGVSTFVSQTGAQLSGNCLAADPLFVNRAAYDYRLQAASPCQGAGAFALPAATPGGTPPPAGTAPTTPPAAVPPAGPGSPTPTPPATPAAPSQVSIAARRVLADGRVRLTVRVLGAGRLTARATAPNGKRRVTYATASTRARKARTVTLTLKPSKAGRRVLRQRKRLTLTVTVTLRPASGRPITRRTTLALRP